MSKKLKYPSPTSGTFPSKTSRIVAPLNVENLFRIDAIRISKILEQIQYAIIAFIIAFSIGTMTDRLFPLEKNIREISIYKLWADVILQLCIIVISAYYIPKIARSFPFLFALSDDYIVSKHGESLSGVVLAMDIIFIGVQKNFLQRISILQERYYP